MIKRPLLYLSPILAVALLFFVSCGGGGSSGEDAPELLRFVNALVEEDSVQVTIGAENPEQVEINYGNDSGYLNAPEGDDIPLRVRKTGSVLPSISESLSIESGKSYSYYIVESEGEVVGTLVEDTDDVEDTTIVNTRIFNAAVSDEAVDLYITFPGRGISDVEPVISGAAFNTISDLISFDAGSYKLSATRAGSKTVIASIAAAEFSGGGTYTLVLFEDQDGGSPYFLSLLKQAN